MANLYTSSPFLFMRQRGQKEKLEEKIEMRGRGGKGESFH